MRNWAYMMLREGQRFRGGQALKDAIEIESQRAQSRADGWVINKLVEEWGSKEPDAALKWIESHSQQVDREALTKAVGLRQLSRDPVSALKTLARIENPLIRRDAMREAGSRIGFKVEELNSIQKLSAFDLQEYFNGMTSNENNDILQQALLGAQVLPDLNQRCQAGYGILMGLSGGAATGLIELEKRKGSKTI
jgi:hypothetical protein